jgi:hypothetical protein
MRLFLICHLFLSILAVVYRNESGECPRGLFRDNLASSCNVSCAGGCECMRNLRGDIGCINLTKSQPLRTINYPEGCTDRLFQLRDHRCNIKGNGTMYRLLDHKHNIKGYETMCPAGCKYNKGNNLCIAEIKITEFGDVKFCEPFESLRCLHDAIDDTKKYPTCYDNYINNVSDICYYGLKLRYPLRVANKYRNIKCKYSNMYCDSDYCKTQILENYGSCPKYHTLFG